MGGLILPAWYGRLMRIEINEGRDPEPWEYDEDLSDLEEPDDNDNDRECECDSDASECDCDYDLESERSHSGSEYDPYYSLKEAREERKRELRDIRLKEQKAKERQRDFEGLPETEMQEALEHLRETVRQGLQPPELDLDGNDLFHIYSVDHVDHCYSPDDNDPKYLLLVNSEPGATEFDCAIRISETCDSVFAAFSPPKHASLEGQQVKSRDGKFDIELLFISNDYILVTVPKELVFMDRTETPSAPETFKFIGVREDCEKEIARQAGKSRSPSPRETWFELNHPMGDYYDHRYSESFL
ncbi:hypothetical protein NM208_g3974 [Fusarium decemcellulare]|uniref:Uncharacterized protein n=1 Tax=Fusarium decemcellulare TaxID=57161 RepID=A0ACC1SMN8_9HYPO|nr:hypothetical protein NM208_g3974 [Fusarium decemcellulare]